MLNSIGPRIGPCGTPVKMFTNSLNILFNFTLCFIPGKYEKMNRRASLEKPFGNKNPMVNEIKCFRQIN